MILQHKDDLPAFRTAIRDWISRVVPVDWQRHMEDTSTRDFYEFQRWWMAELDKVGLATPHWPAAHGGADLKLKHQVVIAEEMARSDAPSPSMYVVSLNHIPATLFAWGTAAQKTRYLPGVAKGTVWCQGFSEPNAGSDLASLRTKAAREGDHYVVNGQKIWSSFSMFADYCILLTRTDFQAKKHAGITFLILDMHAPGVEVRPIRQANGHAEFGEIFLTDVRIPIENRVGEENQGWTVCQSTLAAERGILAFEWIERLRYAYEHFHSAAVRADAAWLKDDELRRGFMQLFAELQALRRLVRQVLAENEHGPAGLSITPSFVKLFGTSLLQRFNDFLVRARGLDSQQMILTADDFGANGMFGYITSFGETIAAGTNEIMRNIIAERGLGLPK